MAYGRLFVISGPSGVGKGTLVARVLDQHPECWLSVSITTREPREGEIDGKHYHFLSEEEFARIVEEDGFLEWADVHDGCYGTPRADVEEQLAAGKTVLLEIDVKGGLQVREKRPDAHLVFVDPPSLTVLRERLEGRGTETPEQIDKRMRTAELEIAQKMKYDFVLLNDDLDVATDELISYIQSFAQEEKDGQA